VFTNIDVSKLNPIASFIDGQGGLDFKLNVNGQAMHSEITIVKQASTDNPDSAQFTINNPYVSVYRPTVKILSSGDIFDVKTAARNELSAELQNIKLTFTSKIKYSVGSIIEVSSKKLQLNKLTKFFIDSMSINGDITGETYSYSCSLPDVYSNNDIVNIFI
jgi:hypothetical protein